jgi:hypothetical protein
MTEPNKQKKHYQLKSRKLWIDSISLGFSIFGVVSAVLGVVGVSFQSTLSNFWLVLIFTILAILVCYLIAVCYKWWRFRDSLVIKIRGIKVTLKQGDIFQENGLKVIPVDEAFTTDRNIISQNSLHGKLLNKLIEDNEMEAFSNTLVNDRNALPLGSVKTYNDYILLVLSRLDENNEAHTDNQKYESSLRKMWQEIGRVYNEKPIYLPIIGDGIIRFDGVSEKPSPSALLKCMLCTLKSSSVQIKAPVTILIFDRINEINFYDLKEV